MNKDSFGYRAKDSIAIIESLYAKDTLTKEEKKIIKKELKKIVILLNDVTDIWISKNFKGE